jgi:cell fate (sporulation/competence/biofilm development) regulator YlbF (YheA/YmcA/DUF963 family)
MKGQLLFMLAIAILLLAGCSAVEDAQSKVCESLDKIEEPLGSLEDIDADTKIEDLKNAGDKLDQVLDTIDRTGIDLGLDALDDLEEKFRSLQTTIDQAEESGSTEETIDEIRQKVAEIRASYDKLKETVCNSGN